MLKHWSLIVAAVYLLILAVLIPLIGAVAFGTVPTFRGSVRDWSEWLLVCAVMGLAQFALLRTPVRMANRRPVTRSPLIFTVLAAGFALALLAAGAACALFDFVEPKGPGAENAAWVALVLVLGSWVFWAVYFYRIGRRDGVDHGVGRIRRTLVAGSVLDLLVAVPTHIAVRQRNECCGGIGTFLGLATGISVMIFAFGPAVYFLYASRWQRLHPRASVPDGGPAQA